MRVERFAGLLWVGFRVMNGTARLFVLKLSLEFETEVDGEGAGGLRGSSDWVVMVVRGHGGERKGICAGLMGD